MKQFLAVPILAVTLAACAGGGGGPGPVTTQPENPDPIWGPWQFGKEIGGDILDAVTITLDEIVTTIGGNLVITRTEQQGDFMVTFGHYSEVIRVTETPQVSRVVTTAVTRTDTRECLENCQ